MKTCMKISKSIIACLLTILMVSCSNNSEEFDAQGNFEANPVMVSSQMPGTLVKLNVMEGMHINKNKVVGIVDTMQLHLQLEHLLASLSTVDSRIATVDAQINAQEVQLNNLEREYTRITKLLTSGAATTQQQDELEGNILLMRAQIKALQAQKAQIIASVDADRLKTLQLKDQINKALIHNPVEGVVLQKYKQQGEVVNAGMSVYKIASLDTLILRAYISGNQLSTVELGQQVTVMIDGPDSMQKMPGTITWIASEAEFTPKIIQTRDERVNLVYAIKISVPNDGRLKIGMPGEVKF